MKRQTSSLKTERNKQRETSIFIYDARQTLLESLILAQDERWRRA
ncbi:hypothetical protein ACRS6Y_16760 [Bacillus cytotoxicus]